MVLTLRLFHFMFCANSFSEKYIYENHFRPIQTKIYLAWYKATSIRSSIRRKLTTAVMAKETPILILNLAKYGKKSINNKTIKLSARESQLVI